MKMPRAVSCFLLLAMLMLPSPAARAFAVLFSEEKGVQVYNHVTKVIVAQGRQHKHITVMPDFKGVVDKVSLIIPVPKNTGVDVSVIPTQTIDRLDAVTAPYLLAHRKTDPCASAQQAKATPQKPEIPLPPRPAPIGYFDQFPIDVWYEYYTALQDENIRVVSTTLSAQKTSAGARYKAKLLSESRSRELLRDMVRDKMMDIKGLTYLKEALDNGMVFLVGRVVLEDYEKGNYNFLPAFHFYYKSDELKLPKLPVGVNQEKGKDKEIHLFMLSAGGIMQAKNQVKVKTGDNEIIPEGKDFFPVLYESLFEKTVQTHGRDKIYLEHAKSCENCFDRRRISFAEFRNLGVDWTEERESRNALYSNNYWEDIYYSRFRVRFNEKSFPQAWQFSEVEKGNMREQWFDNWFVMYEPWRYKTQCAPKKALSYFRKYKKELTDYKAIVASLAADTGWKKELLEEHVKKMNEPIVTYVDSLINYYAWQAELEEKARAEKMKKKEPPASSAPAVAP